MLLQNPTLPLTLVLPGSPKSINSWFWKCQWTSQGSTFVKYSSTCMLRQEQRCQHNTFLACFWIYQAETGSYSKKKLLRAQYQIDMQVYLGHPELLVFIDETGADNRDCMRRFGYSLCGKPARAQKLLWRGHRVSAVVAMSQAGVLDCHVTTGTVDADVFDHFIRFTFYCCASFWWG